MCLKKSAIYVIFSKRALIWQVELVKIRRFLPFFRFYRCATKRVEIHPKHILQTSPLYRFRGGILCLKSYVGYTSQKRTLQTIRNVLPSRLYCVVEKLCFCLTLSLACGCSGFATLRSSLGSSLTTLRGAALLAFAGAAVLPP